MLAYRIAAVAPLQSLLTLTIYITIKQCSIVKHDEVILLTVEEPIQNWGTI